MLNDLAKAGSFLCSHAGCDAAVLRALQASGNAPLGEISVSASKPSRVISDIVLSLFPSTDIE